MVDKIEDAAAKDETEFMMNDEDFANCIDTCIACAEECENCSDACIEDNKPACARICRDTAQIAWQAAALMTRGSNIALIFCDLCADICDICADECDEHSADHCRSCAEACRACAEECRQLAEAAG